MGKATNSILMIRPINFGYNEETADDNHYQIKDSIIKNSNESAQKEFDNMVKHLRQNGISVHVFQDDENDYTPDSIFPNNWVSFHSNGLVALYPMYAINRRDERREDILEELVDKYQFVIKEIKDFTDFEKVNKFLEGTGSMILDRENKFCYAAISIRTDEQAVFQFCDEFSYKPICFTAYQDVNNQRLPIYHTNVMMCLSLIHI